MTDTSPALRLAAEEFRNEPHTDFSRAKNREAMQAALETVAGQFSQDYALVIDGKAVSSRKSVASVNPSQKSQVVGTAALATPDHARQAIEAASRALPEWRKIAPTHRAEYLELIAAEMRNRRFELAAWMVYECGKPWAEADGDVAEAIDFCMYYAAQMRDLAIPVQCDFPGEENNYSYQSRGVCVVIAPWNFPLAILTGMTAAALVAGNTVVMKPAEQSTVIAAKLMEMIRDAGVQPGVVNFLPGNGEEVGPTLVSHPDVSVIAFTGSRAVGLSINKLAAETPDRTGPCQAGDRRDGGQERDHRRRRCRLGRGGTGRRRQCIRLRRSEVFGLFAGRSYWSRRMSPFSNGCAEPLRV